MNAEFGKQKSTKMSKGKLHKTKLDVNFVALSPLPNQKTGRVIFKNNGSLYFGREMVKDYEWTESCLGINLNDNRWSALHEIPFILQQSVSSSCSNLVIGKWGFGTFLIFFSVLIFNMIKGFGQMSRFTLSGIGSVQRIGISAISS